MKIPRRRRQFEQRPDIDVAVDRMEIEGRDRDVMCVGEPASLTRALPGVLAGFLREFSRRGVPHAFSRPVKADPYRRAGRQREDRGAELPVHIDNEVVAGPAKLGGQAQRPPRRRPVVAGKLDDVADSRVLPEKLADRRCHQPIQLRFRIAAAQFVQDRHGVDDVADGRQFDQQNLAELPVAQIGRRRDQKRTPTRDPAGCFAERA